MNRDVNSASAKAVHSQLVSGRVAWAVMLTGGYFIAAVLGIAVTRLPNDLAAIWIADAIMLAIIIRLDRRFWSIAFAAMLVGGVAANVVMGYSVLVAFGLTLGDIAEVAFAAILVQAWHGSRFSLDAGPVPYLRLQLIAAVAAPLLGAAIGALVLNGLQGQPFSQVWQSWWTANAIGAILVLPIMLTASREVARHTLTGIRLLEFAAVIVGTVAIVMLIALKLPLPLVVVGVPLSIAAMWLTPFVMALVSGTTLATLIVAGFLGMSAWLPQRDLAMATSFSFFAALTIFVPFCISLLIEQLRRERRRIGESEEYFRGAMEHSAIGMALVAVDGRLIRVNSAMVAILGRSNDELHHKMLDSLVVEEDVAAVRALVGRLLSREPGDCQVEIRCPHKEGSPLWAQLSLSMVTDERTGEPLYFIAQIEDITKRRRASAALEASQSLWSFALEGARQGVWEINWQTKQGFHSRAWKSILGYGDDELDGADPSLWLRLMHPDEREPVRARISDAIEAGEDEFECEFRMLHKDGHWVWVLDRGKVIERDASGTAIRVIGTHTDITGRKLVEDQVQRLSERMQLAVEAGGVGLWEYNPATKVVWWDGRMHELYGTDPDTFRGTFDEWAERLHPNDREHAMWVFWEALSGGRPYDTEFRIIAPDGQLRHVRALATVIKGSNGTPKRIVGTNWDITETRILTDALFAEKERLRVTLESIGDGVISTDTQTRITFMNPAAEHLTGWTSDEALGLPLHAVFRVVDEVTEAPIDSAATESLSSLEPQARQEGVVLFSKNGERRDIRDSAAAVRTASGEVMGTVLVFQDMTNARELQRKLAHSATHDALTGLLNRASFERELNRACEEAVETGRQHAICYIDLDRFKAVNDTASHAAGDALLREIGRLIKQNVRAHDTTARLGGDEFGLLLRDCPVDQAELVGDKIIEAIRSAPFAWDDRVYDVGASIGIATVGGPAPVPGEILSQADAACYAAKSLGRNQVSIYEPGASDVRRDNSDFRMAASVRSAMDEDRFRLFAQEIRTLQPDEEAAGRCYELLLRMEGADGELVAPASFIPAAERYDLMSPIDRWVINTTFGRYGSLIRAASDLSVSINLSPSSLNDPLLWPFIAETIRSSGVPMKRVRFEITESALISNVSASGHLIKAARAAGCKIVLDDFGTGLSSFSYLRRFPIDYLKIEGGVIGQIDNGGIDQAIVRSINDIAHELGARTIAEWVETEETIEILRAMGIDCAQGYAIARPVLLDSVIGEPAGEGAARQALSA